MSFIVYNNDMMSILIFRDFLRWTPQLAPLLKSGKIKSVGVSNHNLAEIKRLETLADKADVSTIREWEKKME